MNASAIIIGGGIGGLFTGAILAKEGMRVTVLEKNSIIGGGLQCFRRNDKIYETGMHVMGGFQPGGNLDLLCRWLGISDRLSIHHIDSDCIDEVKYASTGDLYRIPSGREAFVKRMSEYFPEEAEGIRAYVDEIFRQTEEVPLYYLKKETPGFGPHSEKFSWPADKVIAFYVSDPKLRELLAYLNPLYGGVAGHTPSFVHALINVLYLNGASRFIGGSQQLADALRDTITDRGGQVLNHTEVSRIEVADKSVRYVETLDGRRFTADWYVSSIHPVEMLRIATPGTFHKSFSGRLNAIPVSCSAFSLYVDLKPDRLPYIDHTCYYMEDYGHMWDQDSHNEEEWPKGFMYMTPPDENQGKYASRLLVHCIMSYDRVRQWENTTVGHRGKEYEEWKERCKSRIIERLARIIPGFEDMVEHAYGSSPLTIRDYYRTKEGAIYGYRKDCDNLLLSQLPAYTKVRNLLLTGQNLYLHGICGVPLTAITTAEAIFGHYTITEKIRRNED